MNSLAEQQARIKAQFEDWKLSIGEGLGSAGIWTTTIVESMQPFIMMLPALAPLGKIFWTAGVGALSYANTVLASAIPATVSFTTKTWLASSALLKSSGIMLVQGVKALGYYIASLVTGGASSIAFGIQSSIAFSTFSASATTACSIVTTAISSIPIIGWVALGITAIAGFSIYLWNTSVKFRATIKGLWAYVKTTFMGLWHLTKRVFGAIGKLILSAFRLDGKGIKNAIGQMKGAFVELGTASAYAFQEAYDKELKDSTAKEKEKAKSKKETKALASQGQTNTVIPIPKASVPISTNAHSSVGVGSGGVQSGSTKTINISIDRLVGELTIQTTNLQESSERIKEEVIKALMSAVNDVNLAI